MPEMAMGREEVMDDIVSECSISSSLVYGDLNMSLELKTTKEQHEVEKVQKTDKGVHAPFSRSKTPNAKAGIS